MVSFLNEATDLFDRLKLFELCYLDFQKAFDSVNRRARWTVAEGNEVGHMLPEKLFSLSGCQAEVN